MEAQRARGEEERGGSGREGHVRVGGKGVTLGPEITSFRACTAKGWQRECAMAYSPCPGLPAVVVSENFGNKLTLSGERTRGERGRKGKRDKEATDQLPNPSAEPIERQPRWNGLADAAGIVSLVA